MYAFVGGRNFIITKHGTRKTYLVEKLVVSRRRARNAFLEQTL